MKCRDPLRKSSCGCCETPTGANPEAIENRPGLSAISYRIGTYATFRQAMIQAISSYYELKGNVWTARTSDDYGITFIEMWAYLADILTFYQERIANEAYLRTAILPESVRWMAGLLDYKLSPGSAASVHLAFTLEKEKQLKIPAGLRVQSVPGQSEKSQKFETVEAVDASAGINRLRIYPSPHPFNPFLPGRKQAYLEQGFSAVASKMLSPGDQFVVFFNDSSGNVHIEEKVVENLLQDGDLTTLVWKPRIQSKIRNLKNPRAFKFVRKLRLFGYNAPDKYLKSDIDNGNIVWKEIIEGTNEYSFSKIAGGSTLDLDGVYDELKLGTQILISIKRAMDNPDSISQALLSKINSISRVSVSKGPMSAIVSQITISGALPLIDNLRTVEIYLLEIPEIRFLKYHYSSKIRGSTIYIPSILAEEIGNKQKLILDDKDSRPQLVSVTATDTSAINPRLKAVSFAPELGRVLDSKSAFLYGNIAQATHGETVRDEILGDGNASLGLQSFPIGNPRVTYVSQPTAPRGVANTLQLRVDGILWHEVNNLYGHYGDERVYTTEVDNDGKMTVSFGDGINGARLTSGSRNVSATYRKGLGREGNKVKAGSLKILLDRPIGLKSVVNPADAKGGEDPENLEDARKNAPNTVRTFDRIVSLRDFEDAAREFKGMIAKAKSSWHWDGEDQSVLLTVAAKGDAIVDDNDPQLCELVSYLNARRDLNRKLIVKVCEKVPIAVEAEVKVDPDYLGEAVQKAAASELLDCLSFDNLELGQAIHLSDLYLALQGVEGVVAARITRLCKKSSSSTEPEKHIFLKPNELAAIEDPSIDIKMEIWRDEP